VKTRMLTIVSALLFPFIVVGAEPALRSDQRISAASAWNIDGDGTSTWCEGCCTAPLAWGCCIVSNPFRHPYPEDPD
jgi:hypothetical protein